MGAQLLLFGLGASQPEPGDFLWGALSGTVLTLLVCAIVVQLVVSREKMRRYAIGWAAGLFACVAVVGVGFFLIVITAG